MDKRMNDSSIALKNDILSHKPLTFRGVFEGNRISITLQCDHCVNNPQELMLDKKQSVYSEQNRGWKMNDVPIFYDGLGTSNITICMSYMYMMLTQLDMFVEDIEEFIQKYQMPCEPSYILNKVINYRVQICDLLLNIYDDYEESLNKIMDTTKLLVKLYNIFAKKAIPDEVVTDDDLNVYHKRFHVIVRLIRRVFDEEKYDSLIPMIKKIKANALNFTKYWNTYDISNEDMLDIQHDKVNHYFIFAFTTLVSCMATGRSKKSILCSKHNIIIYRILLKTLGFEVIS
jgi:hypothetical protein